MKKVELTTTLNKLHAADACTNGYKQLLQYLGTDFDHDAPINLLTILESNGPNDMLWCLRATHQNCDKVSRLMVADFAESVLHVFESNCPNDDRPRKSIAAARDFANGKISAAARATACAAAWDAASAASLAASLTAESAASCNDPFGVAVAVACAAASAASSAAANAASRDSILAAARASARTSARTDAWGDIRKIIMNHLAE